MAETPSPSTDSKLPYRSPARYGGGVRLFLGAVLFLSLAACATKADIRDLGADIRAQNQEQAALIGELRAENQTLHDSIRAMRANLTDVRGTLLQRMAQLQNDVQLLRELTGLSQQELAAMREDLQTRQVPEGPGGAGFSTPEQTGEAAEYYDEALTQFRRGSYTAALLAFDQLIADFPDHELTPEARYYIGEILVEQGSIQEAIEAFLEVYEHHPTAERVPDALYRVGLLYRDEGNNEEARRYLEQVVSDWGETGVADLARQVLQEIG